MWVWRPGGRSESHRMGTPENAMVYHRTAYKITDFYCQVLKSYGGGFRLYECTAHQPRFDFNGKSLCGFDLQIRIPQNDHI